MPASSSAATASSCRTTWPASSPTPRRSTPTKARRRSTASSSATPSPASPRSCRRRAAITAPAGLRDQRFGARPEALEGAQVTLESIAIAGTDSYDRMRRRTAPAVGVLPHRPARPLSRCAQRRGRVLGEPQPAIRQQRLGRVAELLAQIAAAVEAGPAAGLRVDASDEVSRLLERHARSRWVLLEVEHQQRRRRAGDSGEEVVRLLDARAPPGAEVVGAPEQTGGARKRLALPVERVDVADTLRRLVEQPDDAVGGGSDEIDVRIGVREIHHDVDAHASAWAPPRTAGRARSRRHSRSRPTPARIMAKPRAGSVL